jgi:His-Xaa-Ser system protein HxsD
MDVASATAFRSGVDELGLFARIDLDLKVVSESAVLKAAYWCTDAWYVFLAKDRATGGICVELRSKVDASLSELKGACGEFANRVLDFEVRQRVHAETSAVRDTLIRKAFFEAKAALPRETLSDESRVCHPDQTSAGDPVIAKRAV